MTRRGTLLAICSAAILIAQPQSPPDHLVKRATVVKDRHVKELFRLPKVVGAGIGASQDHPGKAVIIVYLSGELTAKQRRAFPKELEGVPVLLEVTGPIEARPSAVKKPSSNPKAQSPDRR